MVSCTNGWCSLTLLHFAITVKDVIAAHIFSKYRREQERKEHIHAPWNTIHTIISEIQDASQRTLIIYFIIFYIWYRRWKLVSNSSIKNNLFFFCLSICLSILLKYSIEQGILLLVTKSNGRKSIKLVNGLIVFYNKRSVGHL